MHPVAWQGRKRPIFYTRPPIHHPFSSAMQPQLRERLRHHLHHQPPPFAEKNQASRNTTEQHRPSVPAAALRSRGTPSQVSAAPWPAHIFSVNKICVHFFSFFSAALWDPGWKVTVGAKQNDRRVFIFLHILAAFFKMKRNNYFLHF